jgi:hypothetical protein
MQQPLPLSPTADLDVAWDWTAWLGTDSIASYVITPSAGISAHSDSRAAGVVTTWLTLSAPIQPAGALLSVACKITTANVVPRVDTRTVMLQVTAR